MKSLDLLAALPTPPHNQTEDVRWGIGRGQVGQVSVTATPPARPISAVEREDPCGCTNLCLRLAFRMESDEDSDSPDSIVPASSPESILGEEAPRFPQLGSGRWERDSRSLSPVIPIIPRASIPGKRCAWPGSSEVRG